MTRRVLVVCHGNINRSVLCAAVLAESALLEVRSAGFGAENRRATLKVREQAPLHGVVAYVGRHRSKSVTKDLLEWADYIVYMDGGNFKRLILAGASPKKLLSLGSYADPPVLRIPDPNYLRRGSEEANAVFDLVAVASRRLRESLEKRL